MSRSFTLTLLLGISFIIASPTLSAQTFAPPVINNLDGDVVNYQSYNGVRLDISGNSTKNSPVLLLSLAPQVTVLTPVNSSML